MPRTQTFSTTCADGINQHVEVIRNNQCADARNVWYRGGVVKQRPGCVGIIGTGLGSALGGTDLVTEFSTPPEPEYTRTNDLSNLRAGLDSWVIGADDKFSVLILKMLTTNSNQTQFQVTYWNGSNWVSLFVTEVTEYPNRLAWHLSDDIVSGGGFDSNSFVFVPPADWQKRILSGSILTTGNKYWLRFTPTQVDTDATSVVDTFTLYSELAEVWTTSINASDFSIGKRYLNVLCYADRPYGYVFYASDLLRLGAQRIYAPDVVLKKQPHFAPVIQFDQTFFSAGQLVYVANARERSDTGGLASPVLATVEDGNWAIGTGAPYDRNSVAQLSEFPKASIIRFFGNRLWFADILDEQTAVRWGAAAPYHKVIPSLGIEYVNQQPTAMDSLGENMVVYTQDTITQMVFQNIDEFGVAHFSPIGVQHGERAFGCVAPNSIRTVLNQHVFLSELGLAAFDGVNVRQVSLDPKTGVDRLENVWASLNPGARYAAAAAHWKSQKVYLLSVPTNGSHVNNLTVMWDYVRDVFWLWEGIEAQFWFEDEGSNDEEVLYFTNSKLDTFQFGYGDHDHGATINSYVVTGPVGLRDGTRKTLTDIRLTTKNTADRLTVEVLPNGSFGRAKNGTIQLGDYNEAKWGTAVWGRAKWLETVSRRKKQGFHSDAEFYQVKVTGAGRGKPFSLVQLDATVLHKYDGG